MLTAAQAERLLSAWLGAPVACTEITRLHRGLGAINGGDGQATWAELFAQRLQKVRSHPDVERRLPSSVLARVDAAIIAAEAVLGDPGVPTLVHGDVWDGNLIVHREAGRWRLVGLLDPGSEYADVEFEQAYLEVFDYRRGGPVRGLHGAPAAAPRGTNGAARSTGCTWPWSTWACSVTPSSASTRPGSRRPYTNRPAASHFGDAELMPGS